MLQNKLQLIYKPYYEKGYHHYFDYSNGEKLKHWIEGFSTEQFSKLENVEKFIATLFAKCKKCDDRTKYAFQYNKEFRDRNSELCMFTCEKCDVEFFVCLQCLQEKIRNYEINFSEENSFEVDLMRLVEHHNDSNEFLCGFLSSLFPNERYKKIYDDCETSIFIESGEVFIKEYGEKNLLSEYEELPEDFFFNTNNVKLFKCFSSWSDCGPIGIENGKFFYHDPKFGIITGKDGGLETAWECDSHGVHQYTDK